MAGTSAQHAYHSQQAEQAQQGQHRGCSPPPQESPGKASTTTSAQTTDAGLGAALRSERSTGFESFRPRARTAAWVGSVGASEFGHPNPPQTQGLDGRSNSSGLDGLLEAIGLLGE